MKLRDLKLYYVLKVYKTTIHFIRNNLLYMSKDRVLTDWNRLYKDRVSDSIS